MKKPLVIFGSSRKEGETKKALLHVFKKSEIDFVDLSDLKISYYDYENHNISDDFISLAEKMVKYEQIILATPVYWYSMSAIMKTFMDRWADLLSIRKDLGRALEGKKLFVITSYAISCRGFEDTFEQTCQYMNMQYGGCYYYYNGEDKNLKNKNEFHAILFKNLILK